MASINHVVVPGGDTKFPWDPSGSFSSIAALSLIDGFINTPLIYNQLTTTQGIVANTYAAGLCQVYSFDDITNWYLPAICEMAFDTTDGICTTNNNTDPYTQNFNNVPNYPSLNSFWSSTQYTIGQAYSIYNLSILDRTDKSDLLHVICAHRF